MKIRHATIEDLPRLAPCAAEFYAASEHLRDFDLEWFCGQWKQYIDLGIGVIFVLDDDGEIAGCLGAVKGPDSNTGKPFVQETFWYAREGTRGRGGLLYRELLKWSRGCTLRMGFLVDSMPTRMEDFYVSQGFRRVEVGYVKDVAA